MDKLDRISALVSRKAAGDASDGVSGYSRRRFVNRAAALVAGAAGAVGITRSASAAYYTYVIALNAPCRSAPSPSATQTGTFNPCGARIYGYEVTGTYATSCNESTAQWFYYQAGQCYVHRGNCNPYNGGQCECWY